VVNLKTESGVRTFEAIANDVADLVLEFGGALSGEHGDGLIRSPFMRKMFGPELYEAFRQIKRTFDPEGTSRRRTPPARVRRTFAARFANAAGSSTKSAALLFFNDTFLNHHHPEIGEDARVVLTAAGLDVGLAPNGCCGRPLISQGLLDQARAHAARNTDALHPLAASGSRFVFLEPSCLSAVREDAPALVRGDAQRRAREVAAAAVLFEELLESEMCRRPRAPAASARARHDPAARTLSSEIDGAGRSGAGAAVPRSQRVGRRSRRRLLRHGRLVRRCAGTLRRFQSDRRTATVAGRTQSRSRPGAGGERGLLPSAGVRLPWPPRVASGRTARFAH
jgi:hypothetical protein